MGEGYFAVDTADGVEYTRGGSFSLDDAGYLYLPAHGRVLGMDGQPIYLPTDNIRADGFGRIYSADGTALLGQIGVFTFADNAQMVKNPSGLFGPNGQAPAAAGGEVRWQWVENSNVDMVREMSQMMSSQRALQSAAQVLTLYDQLLTRATTELGRL